MINDLLKMGRCVGGVSSIQIFFWISGIFLTLQSALHHNLLYSNSP